MISSLQYFLKLFSNHCTDNNWFKVGFYFWIFTGCFLLPMSGVAQDDIPVESDYYKIVDVSIPDSIKLEVGGMDLLPSGRLAVSTRRGKVWTIENPYQKNGQKPVYHLFAEGLHEPLGLTYHNGSLYLTQRTEITRLADTDGDGKADVYETIFTRPVSGNYHEYFYGPLFMPNGDMLVTLNLGWIGYGASLSKWDGWMLQITPQGEVIPYAAGLRSPAAFAFNEYGDLFYAANQGDWVGSGGLTHLERGDFAGHPASLKWSDLPGSPIDLKPGDIPDSGKPEFVIAQKIPALKPPSVWFPHGVMGISTSDILLDGQKVNFGPFTGQLFVGDQGQSKIMRVFQEKVNGEYQGVVFPFRKGFESGVFRMVWGKDNSMFVGMTSRGWPSTGGKLYGLQQLVWTGKIPFEIKKVHAKPDGFKLIFTKPVDRESAANPNSYSISSFIYKYHSTYGSPIINQKPASVVYVKVAKDKLSARLKIENLREGYIYEIKANGIRQQKTGNPLLHSVGYYTLNNIPTGEGLEIPDGYKASKYSKDNKQAESENSTKHQTKMPNSWSTGPDKVITINAVTGIKFDVTSFKVQAGSRVKLVLNNPSGMLHNLVITKPDALQKVAKAALSMGLQGPKRGYVPKSKRVLFYTDLLEPKSKQAIYFVAPEKTGNYPYACTFPGHWRTMQGMMKVVE